MLFPIRWQFNGCIQYNASKQNIILMFWKYFVDIRSDAWLNLLREYINKKIIGQWWGGGGPKI